MEPEGDVNVENIYFPHFPFSIPGGNGDLQVERY